jgi:hypothetical protein
VEPAMGDSPLSPRTWWDSFSKFANDGAREAPSSNLLRLGRRRGEAARPGEGPRPPLPLDAGPAAARANHVSVPSSDPSSGPASVPPSGHDRSTQTRANPQVSGDAGSSANWSDSCTEHVHAHAPSVRVLTASRSDRYPRADGSVLLPTRGFVSLLQKELDSLPSWG